MGDFFAKKVYKRASTGTVQGVVCDVKRFENVVHTFEGKKKDPADEQRIYFEIPEVNPDTGKRFVVSRAMTESFGERARLPKVLAALLGRAVTREDIERWREKGMDGYRADLIGRNALLSLVDSKDGEYTNIDTVSPPMAGMPLLSVKDYVPKDEVPF